MDDWANRWKKLWQRMHLPGDAAATGCQLLAAWNDPRRSYHTLEHLGECLHLFDQYRALAAEPDEVEWALWFHDAVYDPRQHDNEVRSADWATSLLIDGGIDRGRVARVRALVLATLHTAVPANRDERLLTDIDLSILAAPPERYSRYERDVRREYRHVPWLGFVAGRRRILKTLLRRPRLYQTPTLYDSLEARARTNLRHALSPIRALDWI